MKYKNRLSIYVALIVLIGVYIVFFNKHTPSDSLYLTEDEYQLLTKEVENNSTEAIEMMYQYYIYYVRETNETISFLEKYHNLNNPFIEDALANHLLLLDKPIYYEKAIELLKKTASSGYEDSQLVLAKIYSDGKYVEKNISLSNFWENMAKDNNDTNNLR